ncbi:hypothetical protein [Sediminihabitans luteus]|uniref:hypothetical protein n=1 Tax=Sediminihabitans luteus TaxID=1138585 RepID=UPI0012FE39DF|nr:hypothetical protein [Sediminihabitans luteus]
MPQRSYPPRPGVGPVDHDPDATQLQDAVPSTAPVRYDAPPAGVQRTPATPAPWSRPDATPGTAGPSMRDNAPQSAVPRPPFAGAPRQSAFAAPPAADTYPSAAGRTTAYPGATQVGAGYPTAVGATAAQTAAGRPGAQPAGPTPPGGYPTARTSTQPVAPRTAGGAAQGRGAPNPGTQGSRTPGSRTPGSQAPGGPGSGRRTPGGSTAGRLGAGWIAFIVLDALLVLTAIVLAFSLGGDPDDGGTTAGNDASASAGASSAPSEAAPAPVAIDGESFRSPSGNIACVIGEAGVECGIATLGAAPAPVEGCDGTVGQVVRLTADGVDEPCTPAGDAPTAAGEDVDALDYGESVDEGDFTCKSAESGVSCEDSSGAGFSIAKAGITTF